MRIAAISISLLCIFAPLLSAANQLDDAVARLPECGLSCVLNSTSESRCPAVTNLACVCNNRRLHDALFLCVRAHCTVEDAIDAARVEAEICHRPSRSRRQVLLAVLSVELFAFLCVLLRLFSRWYTTPRLELDDYIMLVVTVVYVPFEVLGQIAGMAAFGVDVWDVDAASVAYGFKLFYVAESLYLVIIGLTKISILCFYLRIFPNHIFRHLSHAVMGWIAVSTAVFILLQVFQCTPISSAWRGWMGADAAHRCVNVNALVFTAAGFSIAQDVVVIAIPIPLLAQLRTSWRAKLGVMLMFSLGVLVVITSCVRLRTVVVFARSTNPTWDYAGTLMWTGLECAVSIVVTSLPAIRALAKRAAPRRAAHLTSSSSLAYSSSSSSSTAAAPRHKQHKHGCGDGAGLPLAPPARLAAGPAYESGDAESQVELCRGTAHAEDAAYGSGRHAAGLPTAPPDIYGLSRAWAAADPGRAEPALSDPRIRVQTTVRTSPAC